MSFGSAEQAGVLQGDRMYEETVRGASPRNAGVSLLAMVVLLSGCKATDGAMKSLQGHPVSDAVAKFGPPDSGTVNAYGGQDLSWTKSSGMYNVKPCVKKVSTNQDGIIIKWSYRDCL